MKSKKEITPEEKLVGAYKALFKGPNGRIVLHDLMVSTGYFRNGYVKGDPHGTSFNEGRRSVILDIIHKLNIQDENFLDDSIQRQEDYNKEFSL